MNEPNLANELGVTALDALYPLPQPRQTLEEYRRSRHEDLPGLSDDALDREARLVQLRLDLDPDAKCRAWLTDRLTAVQAERKARQRQAAREAAEEVGVIGIRWGTRRPAPVVAGRPGGGRRIIPLAPKVDGDAR